VIRETRLDLGRIEEARRVIDPVFRNSPWYRCEALEPDLGCAVSIKLETANPVRSFKGRGAELVASHLADAGGRAAVCASAGNLGQALAWSGRRRGLDHPRRVSHGRRIPRCHLSHSPVRASNGPRSGRSC